MPDESAFAPAEQGQLHVRERAAALAALANRQHGVVARRQLLGLGMCGNGIDHQLRLWRLHRLHPGVYAVGHRLVSREGRWMAALLAGGDGATLSHRSAAGLWGLLRSPPTRVEITSPRGTRSNRRVHRHRGRLLSDEVMHWRGIPVTTVSRTLLDVASIASLPALLSMLREAEMRRLPLRPTLEELLERHPRRRGNAAVRRSLMQLGRLPSGQTRSRLEDRFLSFVAKHELPRPQTNALLALGRRMIEVDCLWQRERLIVELDGHESHGTRSAFESDRERDRLLQVSGWRVVRITWRQLEAEPGAIADDLRLILERD
jgi:very-short-patch-repair endonuclease